MYSFSLEFLYFIGRILFWIDLFYVYLNFFFLLSGVVGVGGGSGVVGVLSFELKVWLWIIMCVVFIFFWICFVGIRFCVVVMYSWEGIVWWFLVFIVLLVLLLVLVCWWLFVKVELFLFGSFLEMLIFDIMEKLWKYWLMYF